MVKARAASRGVTLTRVLEDALRLPLTEPEQVSFRLELPTTRGSRPPAVDIDSNAAEYLDHSEYGQPRS